MGTNRAEERMTALQFTLQQQLMLMQIGSPLVSMTNLRNTLADMQQAAGIHNSDRYYAPMNPQVEQQIAQQQAAMEAQGQPPDPNAMLAQAEVQKAQIAAQAKQQGDMVRAQVDMQRAALADDLKRDELEQKAIIDIAEIMGEFAHKTRAADAQEIRDLQAQPRD